MFRKLAAITLLALAASCARQDTNQTSFAPAPQTDEVAEETDQVAPPESEPEAEEAKSMPGGDVSETPSPSAFSDDSDTESAPKPRAGSKRSRTGPVTGCASETCINHCKPYGAKKQAECATAFAAGCFEARRDPLQCGDYGIADQKPTTRAVREMPAPKLY